jgi:hypothetical protein
VSDTERPGGLRLLEWVRGYAVLKELGKRETDASADDFILVFAEAELLDNAVVWSTALPPDLSSRPFCTGRVGTCSIAR